VLNPCKRIWPSGGRLEWVELFFAEPNARVTRGRCTTNDGGNFKKKEGAVSRS